MAEPPAPGAYGPNAALLGVPVRLPPACAAGPLSSSSSRKPSMMPQLVITQTAPKVSTKARSERRPVVISLLVCYGWASGPLAPAQIAGQSFATAFAVQA